MTAQMQAQRKAIAGAGIGGPVAVVLVWILETLGVEVPAEVAVAITAILGFVAAWITKQPETMK